MSSVQGTSKRSTEEIWNKLYPDEPYDFDMTRAHSTEFSEALYKTQRFSQYDFTLAVERQSPFFYQVTLTLFICEDNQFHHELFLETNL